MEMPTLFEFGDEKYPNQAKDDEKTLKEDSGTKNEDSPEARMQMLDKMQREAETMMAIVYAPPEFFGISDDMFDPLKFGDDEDDWISKSGDDETDWI